MITTPLKESKTRITLVVAKQLDCAKINLIGYNCISSQKPPAESTVCAHPCDSDSNDACQRPEEPGPSKTALVHVSTSAPQKTCLKNQNASRSSQTDATSTHNQMAKMNLNARSVPQYNCTTKPKRAPLRSLARSLACLVHGLELVDGPLESVLHHVAKLKVLLADLVVGHAQNLLDILQSEAVALQSLEGLRAADESLDVFGIDLQNGRAVCWAGQCVE